MSEYDSILKEKKKYEEPAPLIPKKEKKKFPWLKIDIILIGIVLIISYIVYYNIILSPDKIIAYDIESIIKKYQTILTPLKLKELDNTNINGILTLENTEYNYHFIKNKNSFKLDFSTQDKTLTYYQTNHEKYIKLSNYMEEYIKIDNNIPNLNEINIPSALDQIQYIKKFYVDNKQPIVEANVVLESDDLKKIIGSANSNYKIMLTCKNHALTNQIINIKATITNTQNNERYLITYQNNELIITTDDNSKIKFILINKNNDFTLKIYKDDSIYSVLTGIKQSDEYQYTYQIIDQIYNLTLNIKENAQEKEYQFTSKIEQDNIITTSNASLSFHNLEEIILEEDLTNTKDYTTFTKEEKQTYQNSIKEITSALSQFIKKHQ